MAAKSVTGKPYWRQDRQQGFSYMVALFMLALLAVMTTRALVNLKTYDQREREVQLLFIGKAYRNAIARYYQETPGTVKRYPPDINALLLDQRAMQARRYLRRLYNDPVSGNRTWGIVEAPSGGVMGVYSLSTNAPLKTSGFPTGFEQFAEARHYQDWKFVYVPLNLSQAAAMPGMPIK